MLNILYVILGGVFFYMSYDIGVKFNLRKYLGVAKEDEGKIENIEVLSKGFSKIPMVAALIALSGIPLNFAIGIISLILTSGMLLVIIFIWANSIRAVRNTLDI